MILRRLGRLSSLRGTTMRHLPVVQRRFFWPPQMIAPENYEKVYPTEKPMSEKDDPEMVCCNPILTSKIVTWQLAKDKTMVQTGGYVNPPHVPVQYRDPYAKWWDRQGRRNFGEPVHEDYDILGVVSMHHYDFATSRQVFTCWAGAVTVFFSIYGLVYLAYPEAPAVPKGYEGGLERELGGPGTVRVSS